MHKEWTLPWESRGGERGKRRTRIGRNLGLQWDGAQRRNSRREEIKEFQPRHERLSPPTVGFSVFLWHTASPRLQKNTYYHQWAATRGRARDLCWYRTRGQEGSSHRWDSEAESGYLTALSLKWASINESSYVWAVLSRLGVQPGQRKDRQGIREEGAMQVAVSAGDKWSRVGIWVLQWGVLSVSGVLTWSGGLEGAVFRSFLVRACRTGRERVLFEGM